VVSDDEESKHVKETVVRKAEMLDVDNSDDEFQMKTGCTRKKSADFTRERQSRLCKQGSGFNLIRVEEMQMVKLRKQTMYIKKRKPE
jgi:hypothetical protein